MRIHGDNLPAPHGRRVVLVAALALLTLAARLLGIQNLRARDRADVDALAERVVHLEARRALAVPRRRARQPVPRVGTHVHGLPDEVVRGVALVAGPQGRGDGDAGGGAEEGGRFLGGLLLAHFVGGGSGGGGGDDRGRLLF